MQNHRMEVLQSNNCNIWWLSDLRSHNFSFSGRVWCAFLIFQTCSERQLARTESGIENVFHQKINLCGSKIESPFIQFKWMTTILFAYKLRIWAKDNISSPEESGATKDADFRTHSHWTPEKFEFLPYLWCGIYCDVIPELPRISQTQQILVFEWASICNFPRPISFVKRRRFQGQEHTRPESGAKKNILYILSVVFPRFLLLLLLLFVKEKKYFMGTERLQTSLLSAVTSVCRQKQTHCPTHWQHLQRKIWVAAVTISVGGRTAVRSFVQWANVRSSWAWVKHHLCVQNFASFFPRPRST